MIDEDYIACVQSQIKMLKVDRDDWKAKFELLKRENDKLKEDYADLNCHYAAALDKITELEKYMWISVDDKLPDKNKDVLVCGVYKAKPFVEVDYYCDDECFFYNDGLDGEKVTHWCYLPEFPESISRK